MTETKPKPLSLKFYTHGQNGTMKNTNHLFQFILASCPLLEEFKSEGYNHVFGILNLDFSRHAQLKYIEINVDGCRYYTFNQQLYFGNKWKNIGECMSENDNLSVKDQKRLPYHINLAWMESNHVKLQLADSEHSFLCGLR